MVDLQDEKGELEAQRLQADGGQAAYLHADLTDPESPTAVVDAGLARFGRLDILVNNAAPKRGLVRISQVEAEDWQEQFKVMMMATQLLMRHATAALERNGDGAIVNVASAHGLLAEADRTIYDACKHAVIAPTSVAAIDVGLRGIRVNAICPGLFVTDRLQAGINAHPGVMKAGRRISPWGAAVDRMR